MIEYPSNLPITEKIEELRELINNHQVIIVCGETGSGKTTQLPKLLYEMGYSMIGHTQPRRIAARSIAKRIAEELKNSDIVASKIRFNDNTTKNTVIKIMTDGILLQEIAHDQLLKNYQALIIDEVHERSLNIDFILGYLHKILSKRKDLKIIITSATMDNNKLSSFFDDAKVINIPGKTYPVEIIYEPYNEESDTGLLDAIANSVKSCLSLELGNVLIFLPGEREIKECVEFLAKQSELKYYNVMALFSRQTEDVQNRIWHDDGIKIIVSTNIAETSLTIHGVKYVIDTGTVRLKRYNPRYKIDGLRIEKISQASAMQRAGRAGRLSEGICIRLYSLEDFNMRPQFTDPEILRSSLANVILNLLYMSLGDPETFPFIDRPDDKLFKSGYQTLHELEAIDEKGITKIGKQIAALPIDAHLAKMLLVANDLNCMHHVIIIVSFLAVVDPREYILTHQSLIKERQKIWQDSSSEFSTIINLWNWYNIKFQDKESHKKFFKLCKDHFLSPLRLTEWRLLYKQVLELSKKFHNNISAVNFDEKIIFKTVKYQNIHTAVLAGLIHNIGKKDLIESYYHGTMTKKFYLYPNPSVNPQNWMVAAVLTNTTKLYARICAVIEPSWILKFVKHIIKYNYSEPVWQEKIGAVFIKRTHILYGLIIWHDNVNYAKIDESKAREIFIKEALVQNLINPRDFSYKFLTNNQEVIEDILLIQEKLRVSFIEDQLDEKLFEWYDNKLSTDVYDVPSLKKWLKSNEEKSLLLNKELLIKELRVSEDHVELFPDHFLAYGNNIPLKYIFNKDNLQDGVTGKILLKDLSRIKNDRFTWLVPGLIREKINFLIKSYPKDIRAKLIPINNFITDFLEFTTLYKEDESLTDALNNYIAQKMKIHSYELFKMIEPELLNLPKHLFFHFEIYNEKNELLQVSDNLSELQQNLKQQFLNDYNPVVPPLKNITTWSKELGELPFLIKTADEILYRGLKAAESEIQEAYYSNYSDAIRNIKVAIEVLLTLGLQDLVNPLKRKQFLHFNTISLNFNSFYLKSDLINDSVIFIIRESSQYLNLQVKSYNEIIFKELVKTTRENFSKTTLIFAECLFQVSIKYQAILKAIHNHMLGEEIFQQLDDLIYERFIKNITLEVFLQYPRYLEAIILRLKRYNKSQNSMAHDKLNSQELKRLYSLWFQAIENLELKKQTIPRELYRFKYKIEELRISLFAEELKTLYPVSVKRLTKELEDLRYKYKF